MISFLDKFFVDFVQWESDFADSARRCCQGGW